MPVIPTTQEAKQEDYSPRLALGKNMRSYLKSKLKQKSARGMAQVVEHST
jgi:hypothetical protein